MTTPGGFEGCGKRVFDTTPEYEGIRGVDRFVLVSASPTLSYTT